MLVTDDAGQQVWCAEYSPFGKQVSKEGELDGAAKFTGKDLDEDTGLYYFNARWMDSETGRFITEDSVDDPNNPNIYVYVANNPINSIDPTGHWDETSVLWNPFTWFNGSGGSSTTSTTDIVVDGDNTGIQGVTYSLSYTYESNKNTGEPLRTIQTETFISDAGIVTVTTVLEPGGRMSQSYTIMTSGGKIVKTEAITYDASAGLQRNLVVTDNFLAEDATFRALAIMVDNGGVLAAFDASTTPGNPGSSATIQETEVGNPYEIVTHKHNGTKWQYEAFQLRQGSSNEIPVIGTNQNEGPNHGKTYATGINIHSGGNIYIASQGCQNINPHGKTGLDPKKGDLSREDLNRWPSWVKFYDMMLPQPKSDESFVGNYYLERL